MARVGSLGGGVINCAICWTISFYFTSVEENIVFFFVFLKKLKAFIHDSSHTHTHTHMHVDLHTCKILIFHLQTGNNINSVNDYPLPLYNIR